MRLQKGSARPDRASSETAADRASENAEAVAELLARPIAVPDRFAVLVERVIESGAAGDGREILEQLTAAGLPMRSVERGGGLDERQFNALSGFMRAKIRMIFADHLN